MWTPAPAEVWKIRGEITSVCGNIIAGLRHERQTRRAVVQRSPPYLGLLPHQEHIDRRDAARLRPRRYSSGPHGFNSLVK